MGPASNQAAPEPGPTAAGRLIKLARQGRREQLSIREAARRANISETRWRHVEAGFESRGPVKIPVNPTSGLLARMSAAVGLSPERLRPADGEAADILEEIYSHEVPDLTYDDVPHYGDPTLESFRNTAEAEGVKAGFALSLIEWIKEGLGTDDNGNVVTQRRAG
jgi:hypothetical protein